MLPIALWRVLGGTLGMLILGVYASYYPAYPQLSDIARNLPAYVGTTVKLYVETTVDSVATDGFRLRQGAATIWVRGTVPGMAAQNYAAVVGVVLSDGTLQPHRIDTGSGRPRRWRQWVSVAALGIVGIALWRAVRWRGGGLEVQQHA